MSNRVAEDISISGNDVRELHPNHALEKLVPDEVSSAGKDVKEEQSRHAP